MSGISSVPPRGTVMRSTSWPSIVSVQVDDVVAVVGGDLLHGLGEAPDRAAGLAGEGLVDGQVHDERAVGCPVRRARGRTNSVSPTSR